MRLALKIIFIFLATVLKAQPSKPDCTPITKDDLAQKKNISDFAPALPAGSIFQHFQFLCKIEGKTRLIAGNSDTLSQENKDALKKVDFGSNLDIIFRQGAKGLADSRCYKIEKR
jgi:hypothetical protein